MKKILLFGLILCSIGIMIISYFNPSIKPENFTVKLSENQQLVGEIYLPKTGIKPYPTMILTHGISSSKESMTPFALELARNGIATITFDFGDYGESSPRNHTAIISKINVEETDKILNYIKQFPQTFAQDKIGIAGHSMGGTVALDFAKIHAEINPTILLAIGGDININSPKNALLATGLYEELNPTWVVKSFLEQITNKSIKDGVLIGNFHQGNARKLFISPNCDHFIAPYNDMLIKEMLSWVLQSFNLPNQVKSIIAVPYFIGLMLLFFGGVLIYVSLALQLPLPYQKPQQWTAIAIIISMIVLGHSKIITPVIGSNLVIFIFISQLIINYAYFKGKDFLKAGKIIILYYMLILYLVFLLPASIVNGIPEIINHPHYLLKLPSFLLPWLFFIHYNINQGFKHELLTYHTIDLIPNYGSFIVMLFLIMLPHFLLSKGESIILYIITKIRQPIEFKGVGKVSKKLIFLMIFLLIILAINIYNQIKMGLLAETLNRSAEGLIIVTQLLILPIIIFILMVRSPWLKKLETW
ncbi:MAG TPA: alpha/beta fold hydrolase [Allocoleopsis sp.]